MIVLEGVAEQQQELAPIREGTTSPNSVDFGVVSNPEFLREGSAVYGTFNPEPIVLVRPSVLTGATVLIPHHCK